MSLAVSGSETRRWSCSLALMLALHGAALLVLLRLPSQPAAAPPEPSIMLELEPLPAPAAPPAEAAPSAHEPLPPEPPRPEPLPPPEVVLPAPPPPPPPPVRRPPPPRPRPVQPAPAASAPTAAVASPPALAPPAPAPVAAAPPGNPAVIASWQGQLLARLQRYKRYPETARYRREEGVAQLGFTMDREGHVLTAVILRSSGSAALDAEALALVYRAEPLPPPPADMAGARLNLSVPLNFSLSGR